MEKQHYELKNLIYKILQYDFKDCSIIELQKEMERAKIYYQIQKIVPIKNNLSFFEIGMQTIFNGVSNTLGYLNFKLKK